MSSLYLIFAAVLTSVWALSILLICTLLMTRGFDFTDESYYLLWIDTPSEFKFTGTFFGAVLNPLANLVDNNLVALRWVGLSVLSICSMIVWWCWVPSGRISFLSTAFYSLAAAFSVFFYTRFWLPTPSYNFLSVVSGLLVLGSFGLLTKQSDWRAASMAALAGLFALASRPPAALMAASFYATFVIFATGNWQGVIFRFFQASVALVFVSALMFWLFVDAEIIFEQVRMYNSVWMASGQYKPKLFDDLMWFLLPSNLRPTFASGLLASILVLVFARPNRIIQTKAVGMIAFGIATVGFILFFAQNNWTSPSLFGVGFFALTHMAMALAAIFRPLNDTRMYRAWFFASLIPFTFFLGTANPLWEMSSMAAPISAVLLLIIVRHTFSAPTTLFAGLIILIFLTVTLWQSVNTPYRLAQPLFAQEYKIQLPGRGAVRVDRPTRDMIVQLQRSAQNCGFITKTPVIDLSGASPGLVVALGGTPPIIPWIVGGYDWSNYQLGIVLKQMTAHERQNAWVLTTDGPRALDAARLKLVGIAFPEKFNLVTAVQHSVFGWKMFLYAPEGKCQ